MGVSEVFKFLADLYSTSSISIRLVWVLWILFLAIYILIHMYEKAHRLEKNREKIKQNYQGTLYLFGGLAIALHYGSVNFSWSFLSNMATEENSMYWLGIIGFAIMLYGLFLVAAARIKLDGYWGVHIYEYPDKGKLITDGIYSKSRHPVYAGQIFMTIGTWFLSNNWWVIVFPAGTAILSIWRAYQEEKDLKERFNKDFIVYKNKTPFLIPYT